MVLLLPALLLLLLLPALVPASAVGSLPAFLRSGKCETVVPNPGPWVVDTPVDAGGGPDGRGRQPCLGHLIGIGVQKGGTSAFWNYLACGAHPRIWVRTDYKEIEFFDFIASDGATLHDYHDNLLKHRSPAAHLHTLCPTPGSTAFRSAQIGGRQRCWHSRHRYCSRKALPYGVPDPGIEPFSVSSATPAPFYLTDITPSYIMHPDAAAHVHMSVPEARVLVLLRDPVKRAASAFDMGWHRRRRFLKPADKSDPEAYKKAFTEEMTWDMNNTQSCYDKVHGNSTNGASSLLWPEMRVCLGLGQYYMGVQMDKHRLRNTHRYHGGVLEDRYALHSMYADQLALWFNLFPKEQILVWVSEDFKAEPIKHMQELVAWLGLDPVLTAEMGQLSSFEGKYRFEPPSDTMEAMRAFFQPHNQRLFDLLRTKGFAAQADRMEQAWR